MTREFIHTKEFDDKWKSLEISDEELFELQIFLCKNPDAGDVMQETGGTGEADALFSARDALGGRLEIMEEDGEEIPKPSKMADVKTAENEKVVLVDVFMPPIRAEGQNAAVRRTVTIPAWLNAKACEYKINFSQALQEALKKKLSIA